MTELIELWYSSNTEQLCYRLGDQFSKPRSLQQKEEDTDMYGEGYYYRDIAKEFGIPEDEDIRIVSKLGKIIWSS